MSSLCIGKFWKNSLQILPIIKICLDSRLLFSKNLPAAASVLLIGIYGGDAQALSRRGLASVKVQNDTPCFSIVDDSWLFKEKYVVRGLSVHDPAKRQSWQMAAQANDEVWSFWFENNDQQPKVKDDHCFCYAELPEHATETVPAKPLQLNYRYEIFIKAEPVGSSISTIGYGGEFCLVKSAGGALKVLNSVEGNEMRAAMEAQCPLP